MLNNITPLYLSSLVPQSISNISCYYLRNSNDLDLQTINARSNQYFSSFLPSSVRAWNNLSPEEWQHESINSFKCFLQKDKTTVPKHFYTGCRKGQILLARLRTNCSSLNFDLFVKNISDSILCHCGSIENTQHFFFHCSFYQAQRNELINAISPYKQHSLKLCLYGDLSLSLEIYKLIFEKVYRFIIETKRF